MRPSLRSSGPRLTRQRPVSHEEMSAARLPLAYRDTCAHLLVPLNRCRYDTFYLPWKCEVCPPSSTPPPLASGNGADGRMQDERHSYEKCQYVEFKRRVAKMEELRAAKGGRSGLN